MSKKEKLNKLTGSGIDDPVISDSKKVELFDQLLLDYKQALADIDNLQDWVDFYREKFFEES